MDVRNTVGQEAETRHAGLFSELLAVVYKHSDPFGHAWVEVDHSRQITLHTRYVEEGKWWEITQKVALDITAAPLAEQRS